MAIRDEYKSVNKSQQSAYAHRKHRKKGKIVSSNTRIPDGARDIKHSRRNKAKIVKRGTYAPGYDHKS